MSILHWDNETDGPLNEANMHKKLQALGYTVNKYIYPPGTFFPDHSHSVNKIDGILSGQFRISMQGQSFILQPGDCLAVPAGWLHSAEVIGSQSVISLDAIKQ